MLESDLQLAKVSVRKASCALATTSTSRRLTFGLQHILILLTIAFLSTQTGCQMFRNFGAGKVEQSPILFEAMPTQQQLISALNAKATRVQQLKSNISLSMDGMPKIKGSLQLERPDRIRIKAGLMGISELGVDVGSNADRFWVWSKFGGAGQTPAIYFARHEDYRNMLHRAALPLEPQWIIDATGLVEFGPNDVHQGPFQGAGGLLKLHSVRQTPAGPITRVSLVDPKTATIMQQAIYDSANKLLAYSNSSKYRHYADEQVSLPHWIELHLFDPNGKDIKLVLEAGEYKINALYGDPDKMWGMPNPDGVQKLDLSKISN